MGMHTSAPRSGGSQRRSWPSQLPTTPGYHIGLQPGDIGLQRGPRGVAGCSSPASYRRTGGAEDEARPG
eukprot:scaffold103219_cov33-Phaeocystis_antarctica.AAC.1